MAGYAPLKITGNSTGLVQEREEFLLPDDAYPVLQNAYVWRERILRKQGYQLLGRLQRDILGNPLIGMTNGSGNFTGNLFTILVGLSLISSLENPSIVFGSIAIHVNGDGTYVEPLIPDGTLSNGSGGTGTINYVTGAITLLNSGVNNSNIHLNAFQYYPNLPVMGIRIRELQNSANDQTVVFDQVYAYIFNSGTSQYQEFIPGTTWNAHSGSVSASDFFWSTNYWTTAATPTPFGTPDSKLFWVTNDTGQFGANADVPRITDGTTWVDFFPAVVNPGVNDWSKIDADPTYLTNWLCMLPFRGRMVTFNTWEGPNKASSLNYSNRIRWSTIGNPFIPYSSGPPAKGSWRDDIRGQGGYLDIPTSEDIISIGFVRDNLVVYCERSTWQLRYTGRSIAPFQIEKVNSELGTEGTFSSIQFDTSLVGIGDKGIVECDSYKSERIDIKIPDFVFQFNSLNDGVTRVQGIRDFPNRLAFWTVPLSSSYDASVPSSSWIFPNQRLVYNYENDSWALFNDSLTALGNYQTQSSRTWINTPIPWIQCNFPWINQPQSFPAILGGNQQGFVEMLDELTTNDVSLFISAITANTTTPTVITSPNHNMQTGFVIGISGIPSGTPFDNLNGGIFGIVLGDASGLDPANKFQLFTYDSVSMQFSNPQLDVPTTAYIGGGLINIRENFSIASKKFNFLDEGQSIQMGYIDVLMAATEPNELGAISLNVYLDYNDSTPSNTTPENEINDGSPVGNPDTFFNSVIPTTNSSLNNIGGTKFWQRVYCATRANFLTLEYTFSNAQMAGEEQTKDVQIDAQILWLRRGGRMSQI